MLAIGSVAKWAIGNLAELPARRVHAGSPCVLRGSASVERCWRRIAVRSPLHGSVKSLYLFDSTVRGSCADLMILEPGLRVGQSLRVQRKICDAVRRQSLPHSAAGVVAGHSGAASRCYNYVLERLCSIRRGPSNGSPPAARAARETERQPLPSSFQWAAKAGKPWTALCAPRTQNAIPPRKKSLRSVAPHFHLHRPPGPAGPIHCQPWAASTLGPPAGLGAARVPPHAARRE